MGNTDAVISLSKIKIHFFYVSLILIITIIVLVTLKWTNLSGFTEYITVASSVTALVLGVLAIIYSFFSTGAINRTLGAIETSSSHMSEVADELGGVLKTSKDLQSRAEDRTNELQQLIGNLKEGLESLSATTKEIAGSVEAIPDRLSEMQKHDKSNSPEGGSIDSGQSALDAYTKAASGYGLLGLYSALRASQKGQYVDLKKMLGERNYEYVWGYLVASVAAGMISLDFPENRNGLRAVRLQSPTSSLKEAITGEWDRRSKSSSSRRRKLLEQYGPKLETYFVDHAPPKGT